jgi:hypothetical protein
VTTEDDRPEPLWASSLADQPRRDADRVRPVIEDATVTVHREPQPARPRPARPARQATAMHRGIAIGLLASLAVVVLAISLPSRGSLSITDVPSFWGDVRMTCHTVHLADGARAFELFRCHAVGGGTLPPGVYRSPTDQWTSDITHRDAQIDEMRISPDGVLTGWAAY